jgi:hypothetical protein
MVRSAWFPPFAKIREGWGTRFDLARTEGRATRLLVHLSKSFVKINSLAMLTNFLGGLHNVCCDLSGVAPSGAEALEL